MEPKGHVTDKEGCNALEIIRIIRFLRKKTSAPGSREVSYYHNGILTTTPCLSEPSQAPKQDKGNRNI